ncbi:histidine phosphotransferase family protein [Cognatishimia sp.]|uniref:histidine phosphotransferase family protein n=1 Tax=Cognatishimia sp. TaxID=2211648 RepID=UPI003515910D|nr:histidine phosphotransferase [Cognatishimia sp.]
MSNSNYADLVASRICHDLINPVGAIANGVELFEMTGGAEAEIELISEGIFHTSARVRFFRIAFGVSNADQVVSASEIKSIFDDSRSERVLVHWRVDQPKARRELRAAFLAILCVEQALPRGGDVAITYDNGWQVVANADVIDADPLLWEPLAENEAPTHVSPTTVPFALLPQTLKDLEFLPTVLISNTRLSLYFD